MTVVLAASGVTCRYGRLVALDGVDLVLRAGERRAVMGPNGSGKTTLLGVLAGTVRPAAGRVTLEGRDITTAGPARRAMRGVARTFQTPALADSLTALESLEMGGWRHPGDRSWRPGSRWSELRRRAHCQLDRLGLADLADTPAGRLAHGQRRLLEIGVALMARPRVLLLDEPAAGLSDTDLPVVLGCLAQLPGSVTVLLVEHRMRLVSAFADAVTVLHQGRQLAEGAPETIHDDPAVAAVYPTTTARRWLHAAH